MMLGKSLDFFPALPPICYRPTQQIHTTSITSYAFWEPPPTEAADVIYNPPRQKMLNLTSLHLGPLLSSAAFSAFFFAPNCEMSQKMEHNSTGEASTQEGERAEVVCPHIK